MTSTTAITPEVVNTELSEQEEAILEHCEAMIEECMGAVFEFSVAVFTISHKKLYRKTHNTVEEYMRDRFGLARSTFYQYRGMGQFIENVRNCGHIKKLPSNEFQVRPVLKLNEDAWVDAWNRIVETAPDGKITGAHSAKVVAQFLGEQIRNRAATEQQRVKNSTAFPEDLKDLVWNLIEKIRDARLNNFPKSTRVELRERLQNAMKLLDD